MAFLSHLQATAKTVRHFLQKGLQPLFKKQFLAKFFPWKHLLTSAAYTHGQIVEATKLNCEKDVELTKGVNKFNLNVQLHMYVQIVRLQYRMLIVQVP